MEYAKLRHDALFGLVIAVFGFVYLLLNLFTIPTPEDADTIISPRTFPYLIAGMLILFGSILAGDSRKSIRRYFSSPDSKKAEPFIAAAHLKRAALLGAGLLLYCLGILYAGYIVSSVAFTLFILRAYKTSNKVAVYAMALLAPLLFYGIFVYLIDVQMPEGLLF